MVVGAFVGVSNNFLVGVGLITSIVGVGDIIKFSGVGDTNVNVGVGEITPTPLSLLGRVKIYPAPTSKAMVSKVPAIIKPFDEPLCSIC